MTGVAVRLTDVSKIYQLGDGGMLPAVDHVTLSVAPGTRTALVGASGSGKSTLLHLIGGLDVPDTGTIVVGKTVITGVKPAQLADYRSRIGFVFQQFHLIPALTLLDNVAAPLIGKVGNKVRRHRAAAMLDAVGLGQRTTSLPSQLSGGQQQRVAIARALVVEPELLLADEPTGNLDSHTTEEILALFGELHRDFGMTMMMATHELEVAQTCESVIKMNNGKAELSNAATS